jgi:hypothetical protein
MGHSLRSIQLGGRCQLWLASTQSKVVCLPASWNANLIAFAASWLHPWKLCLRSLLMSYQTCGQVSGSVVGSSVGSSVAGSSFPKLKPMFDMGKSIPRPLFVVGAPGSPPTPNPFNTEVRDPKFSPNGLRATERSQRFVWCEYGWLRSRTYRFRLIVRCRLVFRGMHKGSGCKGEAVKRLDPHLVFSQMELG